MKETYIDMLKQELIDRKKRSPLYSERAFARDLNVSSGFISLLFNNKRSLSPKTALRLCEKINWSEVQFKKFIKSVQDSQLSGNKKTTANKKQQAHEIDFDLDTFRLIANIDHMAVLALVKNRYSCSLQEVSKALHIKKTEADIILKRLQRLGMIETSKGKFKASDGNLKLKSTPSDAIRNFHKQSLRLAEEAIDHQDFTQRELKSLILSIDSNKIKQAKKHIQQFSKSFNEKFGNKRNGEIYQLNIQLFSHEHKPKGKK